MQWIQIESWKPLGVFSSSWLLNGRVSWNENPNFFDNFWDSKDKKMFEFQLANKLDWIESIG